MKLAVFVLASVALVLAEPPAPNSQYLPANQGGYQTTSQDSFAPPSNQYGAPQQQQQQQRPSQNYGAPSQNYGAPGGGGARPSQNYGAPGFGQTQAVIRPNSQYGAPSPNSQYGAPNRGGNQGYASNGGYEGDDQSEPANYNFKYDVQDAASGNDFGHEESRQGDVAHGRYYVLLPDGRRQVVEYTADSEGYKPKISYEQVGGGYQGGGYPSGGNQQGGGGGGGYQQGGGGGGYQY